MKTLIILATVCCGFLFCAPAYAGFSLSVTPFEGGYDIDFGKVGAPVTAVNKEVVFRVDNTSGKQFRVVEQLQEPLSNAQGNTIPFQNLVVYSVAGSNIGGTLMVDHESPVSNSPQTLYTSMTQGNSANFTLAYALKGPFSVPSGSYRGKLLFSLEAADGSLTTSRVFINIFAEIQSGTLVEIKDDGSKMIRLSNESGLTARKELYFNILSSFSGQAQITQTLSSPLRSAEGVELPAEALAFSVTGIKKGSGPLKPQPLAQRDSTVYMSDPSGSATSFSAVYELTEAPEGLRAGKYESNLRYTLVSSQGNMDLGTYLIEVEVGQVFTLELKTESNSGSISFSGLKPGEPPRTYELLVSPQSNIGKKYQVTQKLLEELVNKEGRKIPHGFFTVRTEALKETKGTVKIPEKTAAAVGVTSLFVSDRKGSPDQFKVIYELEVPKDLIAGDYSTSLVLSISEQ